MPPLPLTIGRVGEGDWLSRASCNTSEGAAVLTGRGNLDGNGARNLGSRRGVKVGGGKVGGKGRGQKSFPFR